MENIFQNKKFESNEDKKSSLLNILNKYFEKLNQDKIIHLIKSEYKTDKFMKDMDETVIKNCNSLIKKREIESKYDLHKDQLDKKISEKIECSEKIIKENIRESLMMNELNEEQQKTFSEFEKKVDLKIKCIFSDIENNIHYLNQLDQHLSTSLQFEKKVVLGFSQGGATAARWVEQLKNLDHLIFIFSGSKVKCLISFK